METRWMTYDELGSALGIASASAKRLAIRKQWPKKPGNDGKARVCVPLEKLPLDKPVTSITSDNHRDIAGDDTRDITGDDTGDILSVVTVLSRHIERLEKELEAKERQRDTERQEAANKLSAVEEERDRERARASQVDALNAVLEIERKRAEEARQRADELKAERDRWSAAAEAFQEQVVEMSRQPRGFLGWLRRA